MKLGDICTVKGGKRLPNGKQLISTPTKHPYIKIKDMYQNKALELTTDFEYIDDDTFESIKKYTVETGDVIIAIVGSTIGLVSLIGDTLNGANLTENCAKLVDIVNYSGKFIYYYLKSPFGQNQIQSRIVGSSQPKLPIYNIQQIDLPDIPLEEQYSIVSLLDSLDSRIDNNIKINQNLLQQAQLIFANEFLSFDIIPDDWKESSLIGIANYLNGLAMQKYRPKEDEIGLPVLKIKELRQGSCDSSSELCSPSIKPEYIIHDGDVVFSWSGSLLVDIWCGGACGLNQHLFKVTSDTYDKWFYFAWTNHHLQKFVAIAADMATTMGHIKREELEKAKVLIPPQSEYERIGSLLSPIYDLVILNRIENRKLAALRDELLPKLMSGELDVSDIER